MWPRIGSLHHRAAAASVCNSCPQVQRAVCHENWLKRTWIALHPQVGSGEIPVDEEELEDIEGPEEEFLGCITSDIAEASMTPSFRSGRRRSTFICPIYNVGTCNNLVIYNCSTSQLGTCDNLVIYNCSTSQLGTCNNLVIYSCSTSQLGTCDNLVIYSCSTSQLGICDNLVTCSWSTSQLVIQCNTAHPYLNLYLSSYPSR
jgi:hypothetical protein